MEFSDTKWNAQNGSFGWGFYSKFSIYATVVLSILLRIRKGS